MGLVFADEVEQVPGAIREDDPMDFGVVLHGIEEMIEGIVRAELGQRSERALGIVHVLAVDRFAQDFAARAAFGPVRLA